MSSKVRVLYYRSEANKWYQGRGVGRILRELVDERMISLPVITRKRPKWEQINWMFAHVMQPGSKLFVWREPRKMQAGRSPYLQMAQLLGLTLKKYSPQQRGAWILRQEQAERLRMMRARVQEAVVPRAGRVRPPNVGLGFNAVLAGGWGGGGVGGGGGVVVQPVAAAPDQPRFAMVDWGIAAEEDREIG